MKPRIIRQFITMQLVNQVFLIRWKNCKNNWASVMLQIQGFRYSIAFLMTKRKTNKHLDIQVTIATEKYVSFIYKVLKSKY